MILSFDKYPLSACLLQAHTILRSTGIKIQPSGTEDMRILGCPVTGNSLFIPQIFTECLLCFRHAAVSKQSRLKSYHGAFVTGVRDNK